MAFLEACAGTVRDVWIPAVTAKIQGSFSRAAAVDIRSPSFF